jgi:hypothetical protein
MVFLKAIKTLHLKRNLAGGAKVIFRDSFRREFRDAIFGG